MAAAVLQNKDQYVENNLRQSWIRAFDTNKSTILDIQHEFRCQGFDDPTEFNVAMPEFYGALVACKFALIARFGPKMYSIGVMTMIIRLIQVQNPSLMLLLILGAKRRSHNILLNPQFAGIFLLSFVLHQIRMADREGLMDPQTDMMVLNEMTFPSINEKYCLADDGYSNNVDLISFNDEEKFAASNNSRPSGGLQVLAAKSTMN